jgi:lysophospholipase L1-like esterase
VKRLLFWALPLGAGLLAMGVFGVGFGAAMSGRLGAPVGGTPEPTATPAPALAGVTRIVALGDSLTRGAGDEGKGGYPGRIAEALRKRGLVVEIDNLGVDGSESGDLLAKVTLEGTKARIAKADLILMSIGGNDLTHSVRELGSAAEMDPAVAALARLRKNLFEVLRVVRAANPKAPIRMLGLYDPFVSDAEGRRLAREALLRYNTMLAEASFSVTGALLVPVYDLFEERPDRLSPDRFHPGPGGYDEIAQRVVATLPEAAKKAG